MAQVSQELRIGWKAEAIAKVERIEKETGMPCWLREAVLSTLPLGHEARRKVEAVEEQIANLRGW
jgi:hypothetical protein